MAGIINKRHPFILNPVHDALEKIRIPPEITKNMVILLRIEKGVDSFINFIDRLIETGLDSSNSVELILGIIQQQLCDKMLVHWLQPHRKQVIFEIERMKSKIPQLRQAEKDQQMNKIKTIITEYKLFETSDVILFATTNFVLSHITTDRLSFHKQKFVTQLTEYKLLNSTEKRKARKLRKAIESNGIYGCIGIHSDSVLPMSKFNVGRSIKLLDVKSNLKGKFVPFHNVWDVNLKQPLLDESKFTNSEKHENYFQNISNIFLIIKQQTSGKYLANMAKRKFKISSVLWQSPEHSGAIDESEIDLLLLRVKNKDSTRQDSSKEEK